MAFGLVLLCVVAGACSKSDTTTPAATSPASAAAAPYSCARFRPASGHGCAAAPAWVGRLHRAGDAAFLPNADYSQMRAALDAAGNADASVLPTELRVVAQNAALRIEVASRDKDAAMSSDAATLVTTLALDAPTLKALGEGPGPAAATLLHGPVVERQPIDWPLLHERREGNTRLYRALRSGEMRGLMSQLLAIDDKGAVHVTRILAHAEMRAGSKMSSDACIASLNPDRLIGCEADSLDLVPYGEVPDDTDYGRVPGGVNCNSCHQQGDLVDDSPRDHVYAVRKAALIGGLMERRQPTRQGPGQGAVQRTTTPAR